MTNTEKKEILDEIKKHKHCVDWCENRDYAAGFVSALSWCEGLLNSLEEETCTWEHEKGVDDFYTATCCNSDYLLDELDFEYCPHCGKKIVVKER